MNELQNSNPIVFEENRLSEEQVLQRREQENNEQVEDEVDSQEIFEMIRDINDPEHPLTLEQLRVVQKELIRVDDNVIEVQFRPTIPHCSMATMIGLMIRDKLQRSLSSWFKLDVKVEPGSHVSEKQLNKQLNDKERVDAAMENPSIKNVVQRGNQNTDRLENYILSI